MNQTELLSFYRKELKRSKNWRTNKENSYDDAWRRYVDLYRGKHYDRLTGADQLTVNLIFATINVMAPAVAINNPRFTVNARRPEFAANAILTEEVLNYLWRVNRYQRDFRLAVLDWLIVGHGWLKVGYKFEKPPEPKPAETDGTAGENTEQAATEEGIDDREDMPGNVESEMCTNGDDRPYVERISVFDMFVDPDARHPKEMRWIAQRTWRPVQDVQVDSRYSETQRKKVTGKARSKWDNTDGDARKEDEAPGVGSIQYCEVIEFYDIKRYTVSTFVAEGSNDGDKSGFLIKPKSMPYALGHPFVMMRNYEVPDHFYPIGDIAQIESLQLELNETRNQMLNFRKKYRRAYVYARDRFDRDGIQALQSEEDNVLIPVQGDDDPTKAVVALPTQATPPEFFDQSAMISDDLDRVSGVSDYQRGQPQQSIKRTATEAAMIQDAANARAQDRLARVEAILSELGERVIALMQQFMTGEHIARIVTIPVRGWFPYDAATIKGEFDFEVQGGSTEPQNESFRRQSALQLVDVSVPFIQSGIVNMPALYQELLQKGFGIKDPQRFIQAPPPPPPPQPLAPSAAAPGGALPPVPPAAEGGAPPPGPPMEQVPPEMQDMMITPEMLAQMMATQGRPPVPAG